MNKVILITIRSNSKLYITFSFHSIFGKENDIKVMLKYGVRDKGIWSYLAKTESYYE